MINQSKERKFGGLFYFFGFVYIVYYIDLKQVG